jgi:hypothetical protein
VEPAEPSSSAGLKERKKRTSWKKATGEEPGGNKESTKRNKNLPGRHRHPPLLVALGANLLPSYDFSPRTFARGSMAGAGVSGWGITLPAFGHEVIQELIPNLGLQRRHMLMDLWVVAV